MVFKDFCVLVHWANVVSALEGLMLHAKVIVKSMTGPDDTRHAYLQA